MEKQCNLAGLLVFRWITETVCVCVSMPNRNSSTFTLSADEWHGALTNQITEILIEISVPKPTFFLSLWWHSFTSPCCCPISVEVDRYYLLLILPLAHSVVELSTASRRVVYVKHHWMLNLLEFSLAKKDTYTLFFMKTKKKSVLRQSRWYSVMFLFSEVNVLIIYFLVRIFPRGGGGTLIHKVYTIGIFCSEV